MNTSTAQFADSKKMDDYSVVRRVVQGEKELFEILVRRYNQKLFRVIRSYLRNREEVKDVMQDTYIKAYDKLLQFQGNSGFSTWLIRIGINEALQFIKKNKKRSGDMNDLSETKIIQMPGTRLADPENVAIGKEMRSLIERSIDELPEKYRVIYVLKEVEGMDNSEIASCLTLSDSNVKVRLHRAKNLMKDTLQRLSSDPDIFDFGKGECDSMVDCVMHRI